MERILLICLVVLVTACVSSGPNDVAPTAELPEPTLIINFIPDRCEEISSYQTCRRDMDELSCRLQFCPTLPISDEIKLANEKAEVIAPTAYADVAQFYLDDLASCYNFLSAELNYVSALPLRRRLIMSEDGSGFLRPEAPGGRVPELVLQSPDSLPSPPGAIVQPHAEISVGSPRSFQGSDGDLGRKSLEMLRSRCRHHALAEWEASEKFRQEIDALEPPVAE